VLVGHLVARANGIEARARSAILVGGLIMAPSPKASEVLRWEEGEPSAARPQRDRARVLARQRAAGLRRVPRHRKAQCLDLGMGDMCRTGARLGPNAGRGGEAPRARFCRPFCSTSRSDVRRIPARPRSGGWGWPRMLRLERERGNDTCRPVPRHRPQGDRDRLGAFRHPTAWSARKCVGELVLEASTSGPRSSARSRAPRHAARSVAESMRREGTVSNRGPPSKSGVVERRRYGAGHSGGISS